MKSDKPKNFILSFQAYRGISLFSEGEISRCTRNNRIKYFFVDLRLFLSWMLFGIVLGFSAEAKTSIKPGDYDESLDIKGITRTYHLHIPAKWNPNEKSPLVLVFHGGGGNAKIGEMTSGFTKKSDAEGFVVVYPNGSGRLNDKLLTWNAGNCCGYAFDSKTDDISFVRALIDSLQERLNLNPKAIYATGMSNGGMLSHALGCELSDKLAAIAPVAGALNWENLKPSQPISVMIFHGSDDEHVMYEGGKPKVIVDQHDRTDHSVAFAVSFWVNHDHCSSTPKRTETENYIFENYSGGDAGTEVSLYTIKGGGHAWPGGIRGSPRGDHPTTAISATDLMWDFFKNHPKK
jgi:polyhydroxybutyrate depolymerase